MATIALLFRDAPSEIRVASTMTIDGREVQVSAAAFYDIFESHEKLEDFVRKVALGQITYPDLAAAHLMNELNFA